MKKVKKNKEIVFIAGNIEHEKILKSIFKTMLVRSENKSEKEIKSILEKALSAPQPRNKAKFIKSAEPPKLNTFAFMIQQVSYIRKITWIVTFFICICAFLCVAYIEKDYVWVISSLTPLLAVSSITETIRSKTYGMAELEQASRFSLKSVLLARMGIMSFVHLIIFIVLIPWIEYGKGFVEEKSELIPILQERIVMTESFRIQNSVYLFVPYLLTSVLCLITVRKMQGKEVNYVCMGISVGVSLLNLIGKANISVIYEGNNLIWWWIAAVYLGVVLWKESRKSICEVEKFV